MSKFDTLFNQIVSENELPAMPPRMHPNPQQAYPNMSSGKAPMGDDQAAKMIADKIKGTPNLNIQTIKQYVQKYLGMVGKAPTDVDHIAAGVYDILDTQGLL
jgi:hypothetical protein